MLKQSPKIHIVQIFDNARLDCEHANKDSRTDYKSGRERERALCLFKVSLLAYLNYEMLQIEFECCSAKDKHDLDNNAWQRIQGLEIY